MNSVQDFRIFSENFCTQDGGQDQYALLPDVLRLLNNSKNQNVSSIESLGFLLNNVLKKVIVTKRITVAPGSEPKTEYDEQLMDFYENGVKILYETVRRSSDEELQVAALKSLFSLLNAQSKLNDKSRYPHKELALNFECIVAADHNFESLLKVLESNLIFQGSPIPIWECVKRILGMRSLRPLKPNHVKHILSIINLNKNSAAGTNKSLTEHQGKRSKKNTGALVREIWVELSSVQLTPDVQQKLSLTLIEHIMPVIDKPVMLTDYFMSCLNIAGPNSLIALQGIFNLIQKFNIYYPNVYHKLYNMFEPGIFETPYKARFYYLSDIFLSSVCLPQGMIAGFIKRFARLCLVAPPEDIVVLLAFIINLFIRHPNVKYLINTPSHETVDSDPYDYNEKDPTKSNACDSSLWEVKLLQQHVLPSVSNTAMFINDPLPSTEKNLANLLDTTSDTIFSRECKKKLKGDEIPVNFVKPTSIKNESKSPFSNLWSF